MAAHLQSAPRSQTSSFEESIPSQGSYQHPSSSGNVQREPTPTTSLSNPSSQEQMIEGANQSPLAHGQRKTSNTPQAPIAPMIQTASEGGTKRTADGQVKERSPTSPIVGRYGHSRTSSTTSRGSEIGEVSISRSIVHDDASCRVVWYLKARIHALTACCIGHRLSGPCCTTMLCSS